MKLQGLKDYIGIIRSRMPAAAPESGYYINSLPGISLKNIDAMANDEQRDYNDVWSNVQDRALDKLSLDTSLRFAERYRIKTINRSLDVGRKINMHSQLDPAGELRGFTIEATFRNTFNLVYSNLQSIYIVSLALYLKEVPGIDTAITVHDMDSGQLLDSFTIAAADAVAGWNTVLVNRNYSNTRIFVGYDASGVTTYATFMNPNINYMYGSYLGSLYGSVFERGYIRGAKVADSNFENPLYGSDSYGLSGIFNLLCSYDQFIINNRASFTMPLLYLCGGELMIERMASDRLNRYTTIDKDKAKDLSEYFQREYDLALRQLVNSIDLNMNDVCIECNAPLQYVESNF